MGCESVCDPSGEMRCWLEPREHLNLSIYMDINIFFARSHAARYGRARRSGLRHDGFINLASRGINGVVMDTKMGPSYANLFVGYIEHQFFNQYNGPKPELYGRYIDDCIGANSSIREELNQFITAVNSFHPALKYTYTSVAFLDIKVFIEGNGLCTSVHYKPTDSHSYLMYTFFSPIFICLP